MSLRLKRRGWRNRLASRGKSRVREYIEAFLIAIIMAIVIRAYVVQAFKIPSGSMIPSLLVGDHLLANKFIYGLTAPFSDGRFLVFRQPKRGDIVVFSFPENKKKEECSSTSKNILNRMENVFNTGNPSYIFKDNCRDFIKRIIGVGGDKIEVKAKKVYVNDILLDESYTIYRDTGLMKQGLTPRDNFGPVIVPRNKFFMMGDNRDQSFDSRFWGFVDMEDIKGKALIIYWSWNSDYSWYKKVRWDRIGDLIE